MPGGSKKGSSPAPPPSAHGGAQAPSPLNTRAHRLAAVAVVLVVVAVILRGKFIRDPGTIVVLEAGHGNVVGEREFDILQLESDHQDDRVTGTVVKPPDQAVRPIT